MERFQVSSCEEKRDMFENRMLSKPPGLQEVKKEIESSGAYAEIFPEIFKLFNILLALPVGMITSEYSFSQMKLIKKSSLIST